MGRIDAGPVERTAIGNVLVQAGAHGLLRGDRDGRRGNMATTLAGTVTSRDGFEQEGFVDHDRED